jgi:hypothetical protein
MGPSRPPHVGGPCTCWLSTDREPVRTNTPMEVTVSLKKVVTWLVVAFVIWFVIQAPEQSAQMVKNAGQALGNAASSLAQFVGSLV